jgi:hypothetical protein
MKPIFRVTAAVLGVAFLSMGALILVNNISSVRTPFAAEWRGPLFLLGWGVIFVAIAMRGYMKQ